MSGAGIQHARYGGLAEHSVGSLGISGWERRSVSVWSTGHFGRFLGAACRHRAGRTCFLPRWSATQYLHAVSRFRYTSTLAHSRETCLTGAGVDVLGKPDRFAMRAVL